MRENAKWYKLLVVCPSDFYYKTYGCLCPGRRHFNGHFSWLTRQFEHFTVVFDTTGGDRNLTLEVLKSWVVQEEQRMNDRVIDVTDNLGDSTDLLGNQNRLKSIVCHY